MSDPVPAEERLGESLPAASAASLGPPSPPDAAPPDPSPSPPDPATVVPAGAEAVPPVVVAVPPGPVAVAADPPPARRSTYLRSGTVALVVVAVIGLLINFLLLQHHSGSTVDGGEISQRISQGIQFDTGASEPPQVACPRSLPSSEIDFECTLEKGSGRVVIDVHRRAGTLTWTVTNRPAAATPS